MNALLRELRNSESQDLVVLGDQSITRVEILNSVDRTTAEIRSVNSKNALIQSDNPAQLIAAVCACNETNCNLIIAHTYVDDDRKTDLIRENEIDAIIESDESNLVRLRKINQTNNSQPSAGGRLSILTSGTTGKPKVAGHSLESLLGRILPAAAVPVNRKSVWLLTFQPTSFAGIQVMLSACVSDGKIVLPAERTPQAYFDSALKHDVTHISGTPTFWRSILMMTGELQLPKLRQITLGGETVDQTTLDQLTVRFPNARISQIYASTEAGALFAVHDGRSGFPASWLDSENNGMTMRIQDGELQILSPRKMLGYSSAHKDPTTADGWLTTGDLVKVEGDRVLFMGRRDKIINVGGAKVSPEEVENFILGIDGVAETKVSSMKNPISGQIVVAEIVVHADSAPQGLKKAVQKNCFEGLARHKVPGLVKVVESIAISASGKKA